jgi:uncharacterized protein
MDDQPTEISVLGALSEVDPALWDACACPETADGGRPRDPFTTHRFLKALEDSRSVGTGTGWQPRHLVAERGGEVIACAPLYAKTHSQGEYIFDHNWAHAYERAGGRYYPKLQMAVPFTPATGRRFLVKPGHEEPGRAALIQGAMQLAAENRLSSLHITFCTEDEARAGGRMGLLHRVTQQFHWENRGYAELRRFPCRALLSRKRKMIRKERETRRRPSGLTIRGADRGRDRTRPLGCLLALLPGHRRRKWGTPYLTRALLRRAHAHARRHAASRPRLSGAGPWRARSTSSGARRFTAGTGAASRIIPACISNCATIRPSTGRSPAACRRVEARRAGRTQARARLSAVDQEIEVLTSYGPFRKTTEE